MSTAFGWSVEEIEKAVISLIQSGEIKARVDSQNKVRPFTIGEEAVGCSQASRRF